MTVCCAPSGLFHLARRGPRALPWADMLLPRWGEQRSHTNNRGEQRSHTNNRGEQRSHANNRSEQRSHANNRSEQRSHTKNRGEQRSHTKNRGERRSHTSYRGEQRSHTSYSGGPRTHTRLRSYARRVIASDLCRTTRMFTPRREATRAGRRCPNGTGDVSRQAEVGFGRPRVFQTSECEAIRQGYRPLRSVHR